MAKYNRPFRISFPSLKLPEHLGGKPAIVIVALHHHTDTQYCLATCMDIDGKVHERVPLPMATMHAAAVSGLLNFQEVDQQQTPAGLVLPPGLAGGK